jgi:hypothetical protein
MFVIESKFGLSTRATPRPSVFIPHPRDRFDLGRLTEGLIATKPDFTRRSSSLRHSRIAQSIIAPCATPLDSIKTCLRNLVSKLRSVALSGRSSPARLRRSVVAGVAPASQSWGVCVDGRTGFHLTGRRLPISSMHSIFLPLSNIEWVDCWVKCGRKPGEANT